MKLLDVFCGAGGCSVGYHRAGFEVVGVDIIEQFNYPFLFFKQDFRTLTNDFINQFDVIHCSPPCQMFSSATKKRNKSKHSDFINECREMFGHKKMIIENVPNANLRKDVVLNGLMFGLKVIRERIFEIHNLPIPLVMSGLTSFEIKQLGLVKKGLCVCVAGNGANRNQKAKLLGLEEQTMLVSREVAMGIDWVTNGSYNDRLKQLNNSIPPLYTHFLGNYLIQNIC